MYFIFKFLINSKTDARPLPTHAHIFKHSIELKQFCIYHFHETKHISNVVHQRLNKRKIMNKTISISSEIKRSVHNLDKGE